MNDDQSIEPLDGNQFAVTPIETNRPEMPKDEKFVSGRLGGILAFAGSLLLLRILDRFFGRGSREEGIALGVIVVVGFSAFGVTLWRAARAQDEKRAAARQKRLAETQP